MRTSATRPYAPKAVRISSSVHCGRARARAARVNNTRHTLAGSPNGRTRKERLPTYSLRSVSAWPPPPPPPPKLGAGAAAGAAAGASRGASRGGERPRGGDRARGGERPRGERERRSAERPGDAMMMMMLARGDGLRGGDGQ